MDEIGSPTPEDVVRQEEDDDVITANSSPGKAIANLRNQLARAEEVDISKLGTTTSSQQEAAYKGPMAEIREKLKTATEIKPGDTVSSNSQWFRKK